MKQIYKIALVLIFATLANIRLLAQVKTQYFLTTIPQTTEMNPAIQPYSKGFAYLPLLSSVQMNLSTNALTVRDAFKPHLSEADSFVIDYDNISAKLKKTNSFDINATLNLLGFGFRLKELYFTFQTSVHINNTFSFSKDLFDLRKGNVDNMGSGNSLSLVLKNRTLAYSQMALGVSRNITDSLTVGIKLKLLKGMAYMAPEKFETEIETDAVTYDWNITSDYMLNISAPLNVPEKEDEDQAGNMLLDYKNLEFLPMNNVSDYTNAFLLNKNSGLAIDLGGVYKLNNKITLSASIIDLGYISWKTNTSKFYNYEKNVVINGVDISDELKFDNNSNDDTEENTDYFDNIIDDLLTSVKLKKNNENFISWLPAKLYLGGSYDLYEKLNVGVLSYSQFFGGSPRASLSLSTNVHPCNWFSAGLSYTMANRAFNNLGFGFSLRGGPFQFYVATDYINTAFRWQRSKAMNINAGLNLVFGNKKKVDYSLIDEI